MVLIYQVRLRLCTQRWVTMMRSSKSSPQAIGIAIQAQNGYRSASREIAFFIVLLYHVLQRLCTGIKRSSTNVICYVEPIKIHKGFTTLVIATNDTSKGVRGCAGDREYLCYEPEAATGASFLNNVPNLDTLFHGLNIPGSSATLHSIQSLDSIIEFHCVPHFFGTRLKLSRRYSSM